MTQILNYLNAEGKHTPKWRKDYHREQRYLAKIKIQGRLEKCSWQDM